MDLKKFEFASSILLFWVKNSIEIDERFVILNKKHTVFFDLIPFGDNNQSIPVGSISSKNLNTKYNPKTMLIGLAITVLTFWTIIGFFIGIAVIGSGIVTTITINENGGVKNRIRVPFYQKKLAKEAADYIQEAILNRQEQTDNRKNAREASARAREDAEKARLAAEQHNAALLEALNKNNQDN